MTLDPSYVYEQREGEKAIKNAKTIDEKKRGKESVESFLQRKKG